MCVPLASGSIASELNILGRDKGRNGWRREGIRGMGRRGAEETGEERRGAERREKRGEEERGGIVEQEGEREGRIWERRWNRKREEEYRMGQESKAVRRRADVRRGKESGWNGRADKREE